ncbi:MAG: hypothetical protein U0531_12430 [Dehalococcoidia bacterium]
MRTGAVAPLLPGEERAEDVGIAWRPGAPAALSVGMIAGGSEATGRVMLHAAKDTTFTERATGFDQPVAWAPDGRTLAVRSFSGQTADNPGAEQPTLINGEGVRRSIQGEGAIEIVGWVVHAP